MDGNLTGTLISGGVGLIGAIIGGGCTILGGNLNLKKQIKVNNRDAFPSKMINIDTIIEELDKINSNNSKYKYLINNLYTAHEQGKPNSDDQIFSILTNRAVKVDGKVYKKIAEFKKNYFENYDKAIIIYSSGIIIDDEFSIDNGISLSDDAIIKVDKIVERFYSDINLLRSFLTKYKEDLEKNFLKG